jgi:hypothetical protein
MDWIHSTTLEDCARIPANAGPLALYVWTQSGGAPYDPQAPRWPVRLGRARDVAELLGVSVPTARRALSELRHWCHELRPGQWTPRMGVWTPLEDGPTDRIGRPLYVRIDRRAVVRLVGLARGADPRRARKAFQIAALALPRMRSAAHAGRRSIALTNDHIVDRISTSRSTIAPAVSLLENAELVVALRGRHRRLSTGAGLLSEIPKVRRTPQRSPQVVENFDQRGDQTSTAGVITTVPPLLGEQDRLYAPHHRARAREGSASGGGKHSQRVVKELKRATWADGSPVFPALGDRGAKVLAQHCHQAEDVEAWIASEVMNLSDSATANPAGLLVYLAREEGSRPGAPSTSELARRSKAAKQDRSGWSEPVHLRRFLRCYKGQTLADHRAETAPRLTPDELAHQRQEMARHSEEADRLMARAAQSAETRRQSRATRPAAPPPPPPIDRAANKTKIEELLSQLQETTI